MHWFSVGYQIGWRNGRGLNDTGGGIAGGGDTSGGNDSGSGDSGVHSGLGGSTGRSFDKDGVRHSGRSSDAIHSYDAGDAESDKESEPDDVESDPEQPLDPDAVDEFDAPAHARAGSLSTHDTDLHGSAANVGLFHDTNHTPTHPSAPLGWDECKVPLGVPLDELPGWDPYLDGWADDIVPGVHNGAA